MSRRAPCCLLVVFGLLLAGCGESGESGESGPTIDPDGPRATFESYRGAMRDGDLDALKGVLAPEAREAISKADPKLAVEMIQALMPAEETVVGMEVDGDTATIRLTALNEGSPATGKVFFVREAGSWKVKKESWDLGGGDGGSSEPAPKPAEIADREPDGDWRLDCHERKITDDPAAGRNGGAPFTLRHATIQNEILTLTDGGKFEWDGQFTVFLFFHGVDKKLAGRTIAIGPEKDWDAKIGAHVHRGHRTGDGNTDMEAKIDGFALRLEFGEPEDGKLPGKIHLSCPDEKKSFVVGSFLAVLE